MNHEADIFCKQYLAYGQRLYGLAYQILRSREAAQDIVQEVYLKFWKNRIQLQKEKDPLPLLLTMTRNACIDTLRVLHTENTDDIPMIADASVENQIDQRDKLQKVLALIQQLPADQQQVMEMRTIRGLEFKEIATLTGLQEGNIRVLLARARKKLKELTLKNHII